MNILLLNLLGLSNTIYNNDDTDDDTGDDIELFLFYKVNCTDSELASLNFICRSRRECVLTRDMYTTERVDDLKFYDIQSIIKTR